LLSGIQFAGTYNRSRKYRLPTLYTKIDNAERRRRASEALAMVGLADRAQHFPRRCREPATARGGRSRPGESSVDLAGGMSQREISTADIRRDHGNISEFE